jgi:formamidopyrimidine-DNA glycosylase
MMEQNKKNGIGSGLGNYLVPEILYRAKISPHRHVGDLSKKDVENLLDSMKYIIKLCYVTNTTDYVSHLSKFLKTHRNKIKSGKFPNYISDIKIEDDKSDFKVYRKKIDEFGNKIIGEEIIKGRTTYWCPDVQK